MPHRSPLQWHGRDTLQSVEIRINGHVSSRIRVENDDPSEVRRLLTEMSFTPEQRRHVEGLLDAWEEGRG